MIALCLDTLQRRTGGFYERFDKVAPDTMHSLHAGNVSKRLKVIRSRS